MYVTAIAPGGSGGLAALNPEQLQSDEPELLFSSYVGGLGLEVPTSADLGNCPPPIEGPCFFFAGQTESVNLQTTANAPADLGQIAPHDAFVLLRTAAGTAGPARFPRRSHRSLPGRRR